MVVLLVSAILIRVLIISIIILSWIHWRWWLMTYIVWWVLRVLIIIILLLLLMIRWNKTTTIFRWTTITGSGVRINIWSSIVSWRWSSLIKTSLIPDSLSEVFLLGSSSIPNVIVQLLQREWFENSEITWCVRFLLLHRERWFEL